MTGADGLAAIADGDCLLRRVPDRPERMWTRKSGLLRPSSAALKPSEADGGLSVDVRRLLADPARPVSALGDQASDGPVELRAAQLREHRLDVEHAPLEGRWSHANVMGFDRFDKNQGLRIRRTLAKQAVWVQEPASAAAGSM